MTSYTKDGEIINESDRQYAIDYIAVTTAELVYLSEKMGLATLAFLLKMVKIEADKCARAKSRK